MKSTADLLRDLRAQTERDQRQRFAALTTPAPPSGAGTDPPGSPTE